MISEAFLLRVTTVASIKAGVQIEHKVDNEFDTQYIVYLNQKFTAVLTRVNGGEVIFDLYWGDKCIASDTDWIGFWMAFKAANGMLIVLNN